VLVALAVPGIDADAIELSVLRAGHHVVWRAIDHDEVLTQLAQRAPDVILLSDHPAVATALVVGSCDLLGVRSCLVVAASQQLTLDAQSLGLHDVLRQRADGSIDVTPLGAVGAPPMPPAAEVPPPVASDLPPLAGPVPYDLASVTAAPTPPATTAVAATAATTAAPTATAPLQPHTAPATGVRAPRVIAVWGPAGAPGRTTIAIGLAAELAARGHSVCLIDADTYGGTVAPALGLLDESPGFAAACRLAGADTLTTAELDRVAQTASSASGAPFSVLTGIGRPHRWPELSAKRVTTVLELCRQWRSIVIIDAGFNLEGDEEVSSDLVAPRRNAATIAALRVADAVVAVGAADPIGLARLLRTHADLLETVETAKVRIVANKVRASVLGIDPHGQVRQSLDRFAGIRDAVLIDDDQDAADAALLTARPVPAAAPRSSLSRGVAELADSLGFAHPRPPRARTKRQHRVPWHGVDAL
jgi:MinD-like ATPase involved in chromosome partitioning or flagellar assembly